MSKTHVQPGFVIPVTLAAAATSGDLIAVGDLTGVALATGIIGQEISVAIDEVFNVAKVPADVITVGQQLYLNAAAKQVTTTVGTNIMAGKATTAAAAASTTVNVKLNA